MLDESVVVAFKSGDEHAFQSILDAYGSSVYRLILAMVCHSHDAEDLTQEVFIKVFEKRHQFKGESQLGTWIVSIARFHTINFLKRARAKRFLSLDYWSSLLGGEPRDEREGWNVAGTAEQRLRQDGVLRAMSKLDFSQRELIGLVDIHGMDYQSVAAIQKCPVGTVKSRVSRARAVLKQWLEREDLV